MTKKFLTLASVMLVGGGFVFSFAHATGGGTLHAYYYPCSDGKTKIIVCGEGDFACTTSGTCPGA